MVAIMARRILAILALNLVYPSRVLKPRAPRGLEAGGRSHRSGPGLEERADDGHHGEAAVGNLGVELVVTSHSLKPDRRLLFEATKEFGKLKYARICAF